LGLGRLGLGLGTRFRLGLARLGLGPGVGLAVLGTLMGLSGLGLWGLESLLESLLVRSVFLRQLCS
jgi:hypothetical protein